MEHDYISLFILAFLFVCLVVSLVGLMSQPHSTPKHRRPASKKDSDYDDYSDDSE